MKVDELRKIVVQVGYTESTARQWGIRFDWVGLTYIVCVCVNWKEWAIRCTFLGCSVWIGRVPPRMKFSEPTEIELWDKEKSEPDPVTLVPSVLE